MRTSPDMQPTHTDASAATIEATLIREEGAILGGDALRRALGYRSLDALRKAIRRGTIPVSVFPLEGRRGRFALTRDVATWLATLGRDQAHSDPDQEGTT